MSFDMPAEDVGSAELKAKNSKF